MKGQRPKTKHQTQLQAVESEPRLWDSEIELGAVIWLDINYELEEDKG